MASGRERPALGKASHRGHGGHRGGWSVGRRKALWGTAWLLGGKDPFWGKYRTEGTVVTEGMVGWTTEGALGDSLVSWRERRPSHRRKRNDVLDQNRAAFDPLSRKPNQMPPRAWRPGLEPAELSFRVPHFFHQTRRDSRGRRISIMITSLAIKN
jgi:hypothetical protein